MSYLASAWSPAIELPRESGPWKFERARDCLAIVRSVLAGGPLPAKEFRRLVHLQGVAVKDTYRVARQAGAICFRIGGVRSGTWWWGMPEQRPEHGIIRIAGRKGYYARFWLKGQNKQLQMKLANSLEEARERLAEIVSAATGGRSHVCAPGAR